MKPPLPSATSTWHNDTYAAISPSRPELSAEGKKVVITGAGSGIGRETAKAFAAAGARHVFLLGRNKARLEQTARDISSSHVECSMIALDICHEEEVKTAAEEVGPWDVLVLGAGFVAERSSVRNADIEEWWQYFETNVKGTLLMTRYFLLQANAFETINASIIGITTGASAFPPASLPGLSGYISSKFAAMKLLEFVAAESPNVFVASLHPGMVETDVFTKSGAKKESLPMDTVQLPAHFIVWLTSPEASFLKGRTVFANWDVDELKTQAEEIRQGTTMTTGVTGWPFPYKA